MSCEKGEHLRNSNFPDWLYTRLEELGFDALVYTRYIMSVLKHPAPTDNGRGRRDAVPNSNRSTLFECLKSGDMERERVNVFVDDIIGKHAQWERYVCEKRKQRSDKRADSHRSSFTSNYDEAFPPLLQSTREGQANAKRSANNKFELNEKCASLGKDLSARAMKEEEDTQSMKRSSGATPSKRPKLLEGAIEPNSHVGSLLSADRCSIASDDDDGELFEEISRVVLAFNNAVPCSQCVFPGLAKTECFCKVGRLLGMWKGDADDYPSWDSQQRQFPYSCQNFLIGQQRQPLTVGHFAKAKSGEVDSVGCLMLNGQSGQRRYPLVSAGVYPFGHSVPMQKVSKLAFSDKEWVSGKCPTSSFPSNNRLRDAPIRDPLLQNQERLDYCCEKAMQRGKRRQAKVRTNPNEIPITTETHFIPIRSDSTEKGYYPFLNDETMSGEKDQRQEDVEEILLDGDYFVYHDSHEEEEEENQDYRWPSVSSASKRSLKVKFKRAKMDKFCQTDRPIPEGKGAAEAARSNGQPTGSAPRSAYGKENDESKMFLRRATQGSDASEHQPESRLSESLPRELWQYQDEKDDELLIRYVSNISLIAPLDSLAPSVGGI